VSYFYTFINFDDIVGGLLELRIWESTSFFY